MQNRKLGVVIIVLTVLVGGVLLNLLSNTNAKSEEASCIQNKECQTISSAIGISNLGIGFLFGLLFLGLYLIVFDRSDVAIKQLDYQKDNLKKEEKLKIINMMLTQNEKSVFNAIMEQEGITQQTLRIRTNLSKSTVSEILSDFEKKNMIKRVSKGKTYSIYLTSNI